MSDSDSVVNRFLQLLEKADSAVIKKIQDELFPGMSEADIQRYYRLQDLLNQAFKSGAVSFDLDGHRSVHIPQNELDLILSIRQDTNKVNQLICVLEGRQSEGLIEIDTGQCDCYLCDSNIQLVTKDGLHYIATEPCSMTNNGSCVFELNVPSGKIVYSDYLMEFGVSGNFNLNSLLGQIKLTEAMANNGCAHASVGNSCPGIYRSKENSYLIASVNGSAKKQKRFQDQVGSIITSSWSYTLADFDEYERRGGKIDRCDGIIDIKPGVYRFTHYVYQTDFDRDKCPAVFAKFEWVREPDPSRS